MPARTEPRRCTRRRFLRSGAVATGALALGGWPATALTRAAAGAPPAGAATATSAAAPPAGRLGDLRPLLQELVAQMERRVPYASALLLRRRATSISVDDQTGEIDDVLPSEGAVFTVHNGAWFEEAATSDLSPDGLRSVAVALAAAARQHAGGAVIDPGEATGDRHFRTAGEIDPVALPLPERFAAVVDLQRRARAIDRSLVNCQVDVTAGIDEEVFVNRAKALSQEIVRVRGSVACFASDGRQTARDFVSRGGTGGLEIVTFTDDELAALAAEASRLLAAERIEPGTYEVVADGGVAGTLAHESFGHGVELDMFVKDRALAEEFVGRRVGSELVDILDDPSLEHAFGSYFFDHEGQLSRPTPIVENGIFVRGLSDLMSASRLGIARSANGRRQDFSRKTYARMSNTFFASGGTAVGELVQGVERGVLLEKLTHGMEDPRGWGIMLGVHIGREIRNGRLTGRLFSPVGITGFVPEVLGSVSGVANDFVTRPGTCGKGHKEYVPVSTGGPHIRFTARLD